MKAFLKDNLSFLKYKGQLFPINFFLRKQIEIKDEMAK
jgi:hypothetical protein